LKKPCGVSQQELLLGGDAAQAGGALWAALQGLRPMRWRGSSPHAALRDGTHGAT